MKKLKKKQLIFLPVFIAILGAAGYWIYMTFFLPSLGIYTYPGYNKRALKNKVYYCTLSVPEPCDPKWNPLKSANPKNEVRARVAAIGYKAQVLNGTEYSQLDFSPWGQRSAESYAWKLYGDDWKGIQNNSNVASNQKEKQSVPAPVPDGPFPFQRNCKAMQDYFNHHVNWDEDVTFERYEKVQMQYGYFGKHKVECFGGYYTEITPVRKTICKGVMNYDSRKGEPSYHWRKLPVDSNSATAYNRCSYDPPINNRY